MRTRTIDCTVSHLISRSCQGLDFLVWLSVYLLIQIHAANIIGVYILEKRFTEYLQKVIDLQTDMLQRVVLFCGLDDMFQLKTTQCRPRVPQPRGYFTNHPLRTATVISFTIKAYGNCHRLQQFLFARLIASFAICRHLRDIASSCQFLYTLLATFGHFML